MGLSNISNIEEKWWLCVRHLPFYCLHVCLCLCFLCCFHLLSSAFCYQTLLWLLNAALVFFFSSVSHQPFNSITSGIKFCFVFPSFVFSLTCFSVHQLAASYPSVSALVACLSACAELNGKTSGVASVTGLPAVISCVCVCVCAHLCNRRQLCRCGKRMKLVYCYSHVCQLWQTLKVKKN